MYQYSKATCLARSIGSQWKEVDLSNILVYDIYNTYMKIYLTLTSIFLSDPVFVDMDTLRAEFSGYNGTLTELLVTLGNRSLITTDTLPDSSIRYAKYSDAFRSAYKIETTKIGIAVPENYPESEKHDLKMWRPRYETDMSLVHDYCLVSVNGYLHRTDTDEKYCYVYNGADTLHRSKNNQLGILSFLDIGKVTKKPILSENIYSQDTDSDLKTRTYLWIDEDVTNKTVLLVLGGYLVFPEENIFWQSGERTFAINFTALPIIERFFESQHTLDLSSLKLELSDANPEMINVAEFLSDDVLKRYLTLSQSFLVIIDTPNLFTNKISLRHCSLPGMFTTYQDPTYPLIVNYGKMVEYWKTKEDGQWSITVQDSFYRNFAFTYKPVKQLVNVTPNAVPSKTFYHSRGYLLEIGSYR